MNKVPYRRKPGDFEIRIKPDGQVIMLAPDQALIELATMLDSSLMQPDLEKERKEDARNQSE